MHLCTHTTRKLHESITLTSILSFFSSLTHTFPLYFPFPLSLLPFLPVFLTSYFPHPFPSLPFLLHSSLSPSLNPLTSPLSFFPISMPSMPPRFSNRYTMPDTSLKLMKVHVRSTKKYVTISFHHKDLKFYFTFHNLSIFLVNFKFL